MKVLGILARVALGVIFLVAAWGKIADPASLAKIIHNYNILPDVLINPAALVLPWVEVVIGVCLVTGYACRGASLFATVLLIVFIAAMAYAYFRGYNTQCGCFTTKADEPISPVSLVRDGSMLVLAAVVLAGSFLHAREA